MFPFWMDSFAGSLPQLLTLVAAAIVALLHMTASCR
jgi:hypothetical protein